jgi:hypothetical protein
MTDKQVDERLQLILRGAFKGAPTPLKDIPKINGEIRNIKNAKPSSSSNAKTVLPAKKNPA